MTKIEAEKQGYCEHCAAYTNGLKLCGHFTPDGEKDLCRVPPEVRERWRREFGINRKGRLN